MENGGIMKKLTMPWGMVEPGSTFKLLTIDGLAEDTNIE